MATRMALADRARGLGTHLCDGLLCAVELAWCWFRRERSGSPMSVRTDRLRALLRDNAILVDARRLALGWGLQACRRSKFARARVCPVPGAV
jgi:hypothetical protein